MSTDKAPHCPRCGAEIDGLDSYCHKCFFNAAWGTVGRHGWQASMPWGPAVRAELARQALEFRAHSQAKPRSYNQRDVWKDGPHALNTARLHVMREYDWLGENPLRLRGEEE